jgi:hypothetical protein
MLSERSKRTHGQGRSGCQSIGTLLAQPRIDDHRLSIVFVVLVPVLSMTVRSGRVILVSIRERRSVLLWDRSDRSVRYLSSWYRDLGLRRFGFLSSGSVCGDSVLNVDHPSIGRSERRKINRLVDSMTDEAIRQESLIRLVVVNSGELLFGDGRRIPNRPCHVHSGHTSCRIAREPFGILSLRWVGETSQIDHEFLLGSGTHSHRHGKAGHNGK